MSPFATPSLGRGDRVGRWCIHERLGEGGHAIVYRVTDDHGEQAALKILAVDAGTEERSRFLLEADTLSRLDHPRIVHLLEDGVHDRRPWMALTLAEGPSVAARIAHHREHPDETRRFVEAERIVRQLCDALTYIHERGLVHRDLKPSNVLLTPTLDVLLSDFGIVLDEGGDRITYQGRLVGTIAWMAPEIIAEEPVDHRADLYGVGAILYALLTLRRPVEANSVAGYLARHLTTPPRPPHELVPDVPNHLEQLCLRLLEKDPDRRPRDAWAVLEMLDAPDEVLAPLFGRETILAEWSTWLAAGHPGVFAIVGPPRSGRSTVVRHLAAAARDHGRPRTTLDDLDPEGVVVVDDLRALDAETRAWVRGFLSDGGVVLTTEGDHDPTPASLFGAIERRRLSPLDADQVVRLLREQGVPSSAATVLARRLAVPHGAWPGDVLDQLDTLIREGWLLRRGDQLTLRRDLEALSHEDLPLPPAVERTLRHAVEALDDVDRELVDLLALFRRPVGAALLARASTRPAAVPGALDRLLQRGLIQATPRDDDVELSLCPTSGAGRIAAWIDPHQRRDHHVRIAKAFGRRHARRSPEVAQHLAAGGHVEESMPMFERAIRRALRQGDARAADEGVQAALHALAADVVPHPSWRATMLGLRGAALLARGRWLDAVASLEEARTSAHAAGDVVGSVEAARRLGQALYRLGRFDDAGRYLDEVMASEHAAPGDLTRARRALADIHVQAGRLDASIALGRDALDEAETRGVPDDIARAKRTIAHVLAVEGRLGEAARVLEEADALLAHRGDPRVRISLGIRIVELDLIAGRYSLALHRGRGVEDLIGMHDHAGRLSEALALVAYAMRGLDEDLDLRYARRALEVGRVTRATWPARFTAIRLLDDGDDTALTRRDEDELAMLDVPSMPLRRGTAQRDALHARLVARHSPDRARTLLQHAAARPPALWLVAESARQLDLAWGWSRLEEPDRAAACVQSALRTLPTARAAGARMEIGLVAHQLGVADAVDGFEDAVEDVIDRTPAHHRAATRQRVERVQSVAGR